MTEENWKHSTQQLSTDQKKCTICGGSQLIAVLSMLIYENLFDSFLGTLPMPGIKSYETRPCLHQSPPGLCLECGGCDGDGWRHVSVSRSRSGKGSGKKLIRSSISPQYRALHQHYTPRILCPAAGCCWRVWIWQFIFVIKQNSLTQHQRGRPVAKTLLFARWSDSGLPGYELACSPHFFHFIQSGAANSKHAAYTRHTTLTLEL